MPNGPWAQARASSGPFPAPPTIFSLEQHSHSSRVGRRRVTKTSQTSGLSQDQYVRTYPKKFQFSRIEFRWDFIPGRAQISVPLTRGLRKLAQASQSLQRDRIWEDACLPRLCQTPSGGPDPVLIPLRPSRGAVDRVALGLLGHPPKEGVPRHTFRGVLRECSRPVHGSCR